MSDWDDRRRVTAEAADALYAVRMLIAHTAKPRSLMRADQHVRGYLAGVELNLRSILVNLGEHPGATAEEADAIKLRLMRLRPPHPAEPHSREEHAETIRGLECELIALLRRNLREEKASRPVRRPTLPAKGPRR